MEKQHPSKNLETKRKPSRISGVFTYSFEVEKHIALIPVAIRVKRIVIHVPLIAIPVEVERHYFCTESHLRHCPAKSEIFFTHGLYMFSDMYNTTALRTYCMIWLKEIKHLHLCQFSCLENPPTQF